MSKWKTALKAGVLTVAMMAASGRAQATQYTQINEYVIGGIAGMPAVTTSAGTCYQYNSNGSCAKYQGTLTVTGLTLSGVNANHQFSECTVTLSGDWSSPQATPYYGGAIWYMYNNNGLGTDNQNGNAPCQPSPYNNVINLPGTQNTWTSANYPSIGSLTGYALVGNFTVQVNLLSGGQPFPPYGTGTTMSLTIASALYNSSQQQSNNPCMETVPINTSGQLSYNPSNGAVRVAAWNWFLALNTPGCSGLPNS